MTRQDRFPVDRRLFPFRTRTMELPGGAVVRYVDEGRGPPLLLLHGNPTWSFLYRRIISGLRGRFRCIAPDYPGFGLSLPPPGYRFTPAEHAGVVAELVSRLDLRECVIMMQDWGGPIGFALALGAPERVRGFVIGNTWAWPLERTGQKLFSLVMGGLPGRALAWWGNGVVRVFLSRGIATGLEPGALEMYLAPFARRRERAPTHIFPRQLRAAAPFLAAIHERLGELSPKPALIVWGEKDFAFQEPERSRFEQIFPNHTTVLLPDAGHFIQEDAPEAIVDAIRCWSQSALPPPA